MKTIILIVLLTLSGFYSVSAQRMTMTEIERYAMMLTKLADPKTGPMPEADIKWAVQAETRVGVWELNATGLIQASDHKNYDGAERTLTSCIQRAPSYYDCYITRGMIRYLYIGYGKAMEDFEAAVKLKPWFWRGYYERGKTRLGLKQPTADAMADFNKAIELAPDAADAYFERGSLQSDAGNKDAAIADFGMAAKNKPKMAIAWAFRGMLLLEKGDLDTAVTDLTTAVTLEPGNAWYRLNLGKALWRVSREAEAEAEFARAVELDKNNKRSVEYFKTTPEAKNPRPLTKPAPTPQPTPAPDLNTLAGKWEATNVAAGMEVKLQFRFFVTNGVVRGEIYKDAIGKPLAFVDLTIKLDRTVTFRVYPPNGTEMVVTAAFDESLTRMTGTSVIKAGRQGEFPGKWTAVKK